MEVGVSASEGYLKGKEVGITKMERKLALPKLKRLEGKGRWC